MNLFSNKKVGIYISKDHLWFKTYKQDSLPFGLKAVISELDPSLYEVGYCDQDTVNKYDFVLYSVNSTIDYLVLIRDFYKIKDRKFKLVLGGADLINLHLLREIADIAVVGRAEGLINQVLAGERFSNVWTKEDYDLKKKYQIRQPQSLLRVGNKSEVNIGCNRRCKFCQYGNKFPQFIKDRKYNSGSDGLESMFQDINWSLAISRIVSSIDGSNEDSRRRAGKPLSNEAIINKIKEAYSVPSGKPLLAKIYNIIGFPWEDSDISELKELRYVLNESDSSGRTHRIWLDFQMNHFIPMLLTPMESEAVNLIDFKTLVKQHRTELYNGRNIKAIYRNSFTSRTNTLDKVYIYRSFDINKHILHMSESRYFRIPEEKRFSWYMNNSDRHGVVTNLPSKIYD